MKHQLKYLSPFLIAALGLCSCGVEFGFDDETMRAEGLRLNHDTAYAFVGDTVLLSPQFTPEEVGSTILYWESDADSVASPIAGRTQTFSPGWARIKATSVSYRLEATCDVCVMERYRTDVATQYAYETIVYARVNVHGEPPAERAVILARVGDEVRGVGERRIYRGVEYVVLRIGGRTMKEPSDDTPWMKEHVTFSYYNPDNYSFEEFPNSLVLDGETHGTLTSLYELSLP